MKISLITFFCIIFCTDIFGQIQPDVDSLMKILTKKINNLPQTTSSGMKGNEYQHKYTSTWKKTRDLLVIKDKRFFIKTNLKTPDSYVKKIVLKDLHPDGIHIKYSDDSTNVFLLLFSAENKYSIIGKNYVNGIFHSKDYSDRTAIGNWNSKNNISALIEIKELLESSIKLTTSWGIESTPDVFCSIRPELTHKRKNTTIIYYNTDQPLILNSTLENPALFLKSKNEKENRQVVREYIFDQLKEKGINYQGNMVGTLIISKSGSVIDFKTANRNSEYIENEVRKILLSMPQWAPGNLNGNQVKVGQTITI